MMFLVETFVMGQESSSFQYLNMKRRIQNLHCLLLSWWQLPAGTYSTLDARYGYS